jgi:hypothetical protein
LHFALILRFQLWVWLSPKEKQMKKRRQTALVASGFLLVVISFRLCGVASWMPLQLPSRKTTAQLMVGNFGGGNEKGAKLSTLPRDVKEAVKTCREATQEALKNRISRMDIEFPVGAKFNIEKGEARRNAGETPTKDELDRSDRELARLFVDMFQPVGGDRIAVVFADVSAADKARKTWKGDTTAISNIVSLDRRKSQASKKKKKNSKGFAAKLAAEVEGEMDMSGPFRLPGKTEVALFVAPGPKELITVEKICQEVGMETLVVLLNARLSAVSNFGSAATAELFLGKFESVFSLTAGPQDAAPGCLLYRAYPGRWVVARKPAVGQPKAVLEQSEKPTPDQVRVAFDTLELTDIEKGVESAIENVAGWFR